VLFCDSQSTIHLTKNSTFDSKTKHIKLSYHWIWHVLEEGQLSLEMIDTDKNYADILTKILPRNKHELCRGMVGLGVTWFMILHLASSGRILSVNTKSLYVPLISAPNSSTTHVVQIIHTIDCHALSLDF